VEHGLFFCSPNIPGWLCERAMLLVLPDSGRLGSVSAMSVISLLQAANVIAVATKRMFKKFIFIL
jgi:hypothetical protein